MMIITLKIQSPSLLTKFFIDETKQPFSQINKETVNEITVTKNTSVTLNKKNNFWYVKKGQDVFPADREKISNIINALANLKKDEIVSSNKNKHKEFGIGRQKIEFDFEGKKALVFIGNSGGSDNNYVRINDENDVFKTSGFSDTFASDDFRDLNLHLVNDETKVSFIEINYGELKTSLVKKGNEWKIGEKTAKKDRVDFFVNDLKNLKAKNILTQQQNYQELNPELIILFKENGKGKSINFFKQTEEEYFARVFPSDFDYEIASANVASLKKEEKDFFE